MRQRNERGIEERDGEKARAAERQRDAVEPADERFQKGRGILSATRDYRSHFAAARRPRRRRRAPSRGSSSSARTSSSPTTTRRRISWSRVASSTASRPAGSRSARCGCRFRTSSNCFPTQVDLFYRTGAFGSMVSVACFGIAAYAAARLAIAITGSTAAPRPPRSLLVLNPNLLYLQATPMTEPLLLAVTFLAVLWLYEWVVSNAEHVPRRLGWVLFAAAWTRYEAWLVDRVSARGGHLRDVATRRGAAGMLVRQAWRLGMPGPRLRWSSSWSTAASRSGRGSSPAGSTCPTRPTPGSLLKTLIAVWWGTHRHERVRGRNRRAGRGCRICRRAGR